MYRFYDHVIHPLVEVLEPKCLVEVGVQYGDQTAKLLEQVGAAGGVVHAVDSVPSLDVGAWRRRYGSALVFHQALSLDVLGEIHGLDLALLDGDHNWYTVLHELRLIEQTAKADGREPPVIVLHDVDFPYGRRDLYYDPDTIPEEHRQPYLQLGIDFTSGKLDPSGINNHLHHAVDHDTPHNGVRTGIEDYLAGSSVSWHETWIPGFHGLGILVPEQTLASSAPLQELIDGFGGAEFMTRWTRNLEASRIGELGSVSQRRISELEATHTRQLAEIERQLAEVADLREALLNAEARAASVPELKLAVEDTQRQVRDEHAALEHARDEAKQLRQELIGARGEVVAVMASPSWKLTRPLRVAKKVVKRLENLS